MKRPNALSSSSATAAAARLFTRRMLLQAGAAAVGLAAAGPWLVRNALSASGEVRIMGWAGYDFSKVKAAFEKATGIKAAITEFPDQNKMIAQMQASGGEGFDICEPTSDRVPHWLELEFLQPVDEKKANLAGVKEAFLGGDAAKDAIAGDKRYGSPSIWGTEAIAFDKKAAPLEYGKASYADLWRPEFAGKLTVRSTSALVGIGLALESEGKLPNKMREAFADETKMVATFDVIMKRALEVRKNVAQFWTDENSAQGAFRTNGCVIGQNWDTSAAAMIKEGLPIGYLPPKEGALAWLQNFVIPKKATNLEQAYAWLAWFNSPEGSALWSEAFGANPVSKGAEAHVSDASKKFLAAAYPGDALEKLWWWPAQPGWFSTRRNEYADRFKSAT